MVYGQILNFDPKNFSNLDTILLLGIINSLDLDNNGYDRIIIPIFECIEKFNNDSSFYRIEISFFAGDTPALQSLGGFTEAVGNAGYPCRECLTAKDDIRSILNERDCSMRNFDETLSIAENILPGQNSILGIRRYTKLFEYSFFNAITMTPQDPMHILLEGVARRLVLDFIKLWVQTKRTNLREINARFKKFKYSWFHSKNKLTIILKESDLYKKEIVISASQMHTLLIIFPLIFDDIVDTTSSDYDLINLMRKIIMISFDYDPNEQMIVRLEGYIAQFIRLWDDIIGSSFPKLHFLIHLPKWIRK